MIENVIDLIGNTPLVNLRQMTGLPIYAKAEFLNPGGSIKDRVAKNMIEQAESITDSSETKLIRHILPETIGRLLMLNQLLSSKEK